MEEPDYAGDVFSLQDNQPIFIYLGCGLKAAESTDAARQLFQMGHEKVKVLGIPSIKGWRQERYPMEKQK